MNENLIVKLMEAGIVSETLRKLAPAKKESIYRSALEAFSQKSFDRVSLDLIARNAKVSKGSLFQYFENKENVLKFVEEIFYDEYVYSWSNYFRTEKAVRATNRISELLHESIMQWKNHPIEFNFLTKELNENRFDITSEFRRKINSFQSEITSGIIERGIKTGEIRGDIALDYIVLIIQGLLEKIMRLYANRFRGKVSDSRLNLDIEKYVRIIFEGISA